MYFHYVCLSLKFTLSVLRFYRYYCWWLIFLQTTPQKSHWPFKALLGQLCSKAALMPFLILWDSLSFPENQGKNCPAGKETQGNKSPVFSLPRSLSPWEMPFSCWEREIVAASEWNHGFLGSAVCTWGTMEIFQMKIWSVCKSSLPPLQGS